MIFELRFPSSILAVEVNCETLVVVVVVVVVELETYIYDISTVGLMHVIETSLIPKVRCNTCQTNDRTSLGEARGVHGYIVLHLTP
jgi:hypothetical protein